MHGNRDIRIVEGFAKARDFAVMGGNMPLLTEQMS